MSAEAMIERLKQVQDSTDEASGGIETVLDQAGRIVFRKHLRPFRFLAVLTVLVAALMVAAAAWILWSQREANGLQGIVAIGAAQAVYMSLRRWFARWSAGVVAVAAWMLLVILSGTNLLLANWLLTVSVAIGGAMFARRVLRESPSTHDLFFIDADFEWVTSCGVLGAGDTVPLADVDYFLAHRGGIPPIGDLIGSLYAVRPDETAMRLAESRDFFGDMGAHPLNTLGHVCERPVLVLDEMQSGAEDECAQGFVIERASRKKWRITGTDRGTLFRTARVAYAPDVSKA